MKHTPKLYLFAFVGVILVAFFLRAYNLSSYPPGIHYDEARNVMRAWRLANGYGTSWVFDDIPEPFDAIGRAVLIRFVGASLFAFRLVTVFLHTLAAAAIIGAARAIFWKHAHRDSIALTAALTFAVMPAAVMMGRTVLRTNWTPFLTMMAVMMLFWAWHTRKTRYYLLAGMFTALGTMFYLVGLIFPMAIGTVITAYWLYHRRWWRDFPRLVGMGIAFVITFSPWLYMYFTIPEWLNYRSDSTENAANLQNLPLLIRHARLATGMIYQPFTNYPEGGFHWAARYNTFHTPYLNIPLLFLFVCGLLYSFLRFYKVGYFAPLLIGLILFIPGISATEPMITSRHVPVFAALSLVVGMGAGAVFEMGGRVSKRVKVDVGYGLSILMVLVGVYSAISSYGDVVYHYTKEPKLHDNPTERFAIDWNYRIRLREIMDHAAALDTPVYFPYNLLNYPTSLAYSRVTFPHIRAYQGESLPAGRMIVPADLAYGDAEITFSGQYVLLLPHDYTMIILPPFEDVTQINALEIQVMESGTPIYNANHWLLGHEIAISSDANPFSAIRYPDLSNKEAIAVFDNNLELVDFVAPPNIQPGTWIPVTLYWRLREEADKDYHVYLHLRQDEVNRRGGQDDYFAALHRWIYPTQMWKAGEIVSEVRWVVVFFDVPQGGYRFGLQVHWYPRAQVADFTNAYGVRRRDDWLILGQTHVLDAPFPTPSATARPLDVAFADTMRISHLQTDPPIEAWQPNTPVTIRVFWEALRPPAEDYTFFMHIYDSAGVFITQQDTTFHDQGFPTSTWYQGAQVVTTHTLMIPPDAAMGDFNLRVGMYWYQGENSERLTATKDNQPLPDNLYVITPN